MAQSPLSPKLGTPGSTFHVGWAHPPLVVKPWLLFAGQWEGFALRLASCKDWLWPPTTVEAQLYRPTPGAVLNLRGALVSAESAIWLCHLWRWLGGGASTWSGAVHQMHWLWSLPGGTGQGQLPPMFCSRRPGVSYRAICRWLLLVLGLEVPRWSQAANQGWLLLVLGLRPPSKRYRACWGQVLLVWEVSGKSEAWANTGHSRGKATGNCLAGSESWVRWDLREWLGYGKQCEPGSWMESQIWRPPAGFVGGGLIKGKMTSVDTSGRKLPPSSRPNVGQFNSSPYVSGAFQTAASVLELRGSESG